MALSGLLHFYKRGLPKSTRLCSSFSSLSKSVKENSTKDYVATEQKSQVEDSGLNKEMNLEITKPAFRLSISWNAIKETLFNFRAMLRNPTYHNKMTAEGNVSVGDKMPSENIMTENGLQKPVNNAKTSEAIMNSQSCEENISTSLKSDIMEGNSSLDMETNSGDAVEIKQLFEDNSSDALENMVGSDISKRNIVPNSSEFSKNGSVFQSSKAIVDSETKKKNFPESVTSCIARKRSSEDMNQSEFNQESDQNRVIVRALKLETQYVSRSTSQLPHRAYKGLQKDVANGLSSIGQGNQRNDKKTKNSQKSVRYQTTEKATIMKSNLSDDDILQKTPPVSNNNDQVIKSISMKKSLGGSQDYDPKRNHLLRSGHAKSMVGNKPNKSEEGSLSGKPLRTNGDVRKARRKSVLEVAAKDSIKLKSNSQVHLSTGQGNLSKYFIQERFSETKPR